MNPCRLLFGSILCCIGLQSCERKYDEMPEGRYGYLSFANVTIVFDSTQERLDNNANPSVTPPGHGSQSPLLEFLQIGKIELLFDTGAHYYFPVTDQYVNTTGNGVTYYGKFHHVGSTVEANYLRLYLSYQNYKVGCKVNGSFATCNLLSFPGRYYNQNGSFQLGDHMINTDSVINPGEWFLDLDDFSADSVLHGQSATVTEPNFLHSSIETQSDDYCTIICPIDPPITFTKDKPREIKISISLNHAFEWVEHSDPAYFEPFNGDTIYDFGLRGAKVIQ
jgi:hypothetical protein